MMRRARASLGKTTTAEGVETREQLELLRSENCSEIQGYIFSRPKHPSEIGQMLLAQVNTARAA